MHADPAKTDPLAFLIVKSMLLTGFDAPIEGVMYLDRPIREAELLQAIARVNRTGHGKKVGIVVDYYGVAQHLKEALERLRRRGHRGRAAEPEGRDPGAARPAPARGGSVPQPRHRAPGRHRSLRRGAGRRAAARRVRGQAEAFLDTLDMVLPRPEGLPFVPDAKRLAFIYARARNRYRDTPVLGKDIGAKVRKLIDEHVMSLGVDPKIPPISADRCRLRQAR